MNDSDDPIRWESYDPDKHGPESDGGSNGNEPEECYHHFNLLAKAIHPTVREANIFTLYCVHCLDVSEFAYEVGSALDGQ